MSVLTLSEQRTATTFVSDLMYMALDYLPTLTDLIPQDKIRAIIDNRVAAAPITIQPKSTAYHVFQDYMDPVFESRTQDAMWDMAVSIAQSFETAFHQFNTAVKNTDAVTQAITTVLANTVVSEEDLLDMELPTYQWGSLEGEVTPDQISTRMVVVDQELQGKSPTIHTLPGTMIRVLEQCKSHLNTPPAYQAEVRRLTTRLHTLLEAASRPQTHVINNTDQLIEDTRAILGHLTQCQTLLQDHATTEDTSVDAMYPKLQQQFTTFKYLLSAYLDAVSTHHGLNTQILLRSPDIEHPLYVNMSAYDTYQQACKSLSSEDPVDPDRLLRCEIVRQKYIGDPTFRSSVSINSLTRRADRLPQEITTALTQRSKTQESIRAERLTKEVDTILKDQISEEALSPTQRAKAVMKIVHQGQPVFDTLMTALWDNPLQSMSVIKDMYRHTVKSMESATQVMSQDQEIDPKKVKAHMCLEYMTQRTVVYFA